MYPLGRYLSTKLQTWRIWDDWHEASQYIDDDKWNSQKWHPIHGLPQTCGGSKYICPVWIRPTANFLTHLRTSFSINKHWSSKWNTHKSTKNKIRLEQITWRRIYIKQSNLLMQTSLNVEPAPSPQTYTNLRGKKIRMSGLDMAKWKFANTPEDKFQDQWALIWIMQTNRSKINNENIKNKNLKSNTWWIIKHRNIYNLEIFNCSLSVPK